LNSEEQHAFNEAWRDIVKYNSSTKTASVAVEFLLEELKALLGRTSGVITSLEWGGYLDIITQLNQLLKELSTEEEERIQNESAYQQIIFDFSGS